MEYFQLLNDSGPQVEVITKFDRNIQAIMQKRLASIEDMCMYRLRVPEYAPMPDILFQPTFMVTEPVYECVSLYEPYISTKKLLLYDDMQSYLFYILLLEKKDLLKEKERSYPRHIFYVPYRGEEMVVVSLELLESLLKRYAVGFRIREL